MEWKFTTEDMRQYLLGGLTEDECNVLEDLCFGDDDFFQQVLIVEDELIQEYVQKELSEIEKKQFEERFLVVPLQRQKVEVAKALLLSRTTPSTIVLTSFPVSPQRSFLKFPLTQKLQSLTFILVAFVLVLIISSLWLFIEVTQLHTRLKDTESKRIDLLQQKERAQALQQQQLKQIKDQNVAVQQLAVELQGEQEKNAQLEQELAKFRSVPFTISFTFISDLVRSSNNPQKIIIPKKAGRLRLQLPVEELESPTYYAVIDTVEGISIWDGGRHKLYPNLTKTGKLITVNISTDILSTDDYILTLTGTSTDGTVDGTIKYYFRVQKK